MCGGVDENQVRYWSVFQEYDFQSLSAQGAYDANRNIFFSVVGLHDDRHWVGDNSVFPERYFLLKKNLANKIFGYLARCEGKFLYIDPKI